MLKSYIANMKANLTVYLKKNTIVFLIGILSFMMLIIMISHSGKCSFWRDELHTIGGIRNGETLKLKFLMEAHPLFACSAYIYYRIVPYGERWLLLLPEFFMALAVFFIGLTVKKMVGNSGALFATITVSTLLYLGRYGNEFRGYSIYILMSSLVFLFYLKRLRQKENTPKDAVVFGILLAGFAYTHLLSVVVCFIYFVTDIILIYKRKISRYCLLSYFLGGILFLPYAVLLAGLLLEPGGLDFWPAIPKASQTIGVYENLLGGNTLLLGFFSLGCSIFVIKVIINKKIRMEDLPLLLSMFIPVFMVGIIFIYSRFINPRGSLFVFRYFLCLLPMLVFVCGYAFEAVCKKIDFYIPFSKEGIVNILLLALAIYLYPRFYSRLADSPEISNEQIKKATEYLSSQSDIKNESTVILPSMSTVTSLGWIEYYVTQQGKIESFSRNIILLEDVNVSNFFIKKYHRLYILSPRRLSRHAQEDSLEYFYSKIDEIEDLGVRVYEIKDVFKNMDSETMEELLVLNPMPDVPVYDIEIVESDDGIVLQCGIIDPQIYLSLPQPLEKQAGIQFCEITYVNSVAGLLQLFWDYGEGLSEENSTRYNIESTSETVSTLMPIVNWKDDTKLTALRVDPPNGTEFVLKNIRILEVRE